MNERIVLEGADFTGKTLVSGIISEYGINVLDRSDFISPCVLLENKPEDILKKSKTTCRRRNRSSGRWRETEAWGLRLWK